MSERSVRYTRADSQFVDKLGRAKTLIIAGCGLLGTSVAQAFSDQFSNAETRIIGIESNPAAQAKACALAVYDQVYASLDELLPAEGLLSKSAPKSTPKSTNAASDGIVIGVVATPPASIAATVSGLAPICTVVMDVGSIKAPVITELMLSAQANANQANAKLLRNFIPCHPMAGSHRQGPDNGNAELFDGRWVFVVALASADPELTELAHAFWQSIGARTQEIEAEVHDQAVAYTSHLPHLLASVYMAVDTPDAAAAGTGFMEFTRLAKSNPEMWSQVLHANRSAWRPLLARYVQTLNELDALIEQGDLAAIQAYLSARRDERLELDIPADEAHSLL